jgi:hypothetical protein
MGLLPAFLHLRTHMDDFSADTSVTSTEAPSSPSEAAPSPGASEAIQSQPDAVQSAATPAETAPEFPEEISSLPGEQQRSNWQQLRTRYDEQSRQFGDLKTQVETLTPIQQKLEAWGGVDQVEQAYTLAQSLFSPVVDPQTGQPVLDNYGLPSYSAEPFVERMASESPQTLYEISHRAMNQQLGNETVSHAIFRDYYGLDPSLIETYRQIQSPKDAAQFLQNAGQVSAEQLAQIPSQYHEAFKSLTPELRAEVELMGSVAQEQYLAEKAELLENRSFREQQKAQMEQRRQADEAAFTQRVEQAGKQYIDNAENSVLQESMDKLKAEVSLLPDAADNQVIHESIITKAVSAIKDNPDIKRYNDLYKLAAYREGTNDKWGANQAKTQADMLAAKVGRLYKAEVAKQVKWWNEKLGMARNGTQNALASAQTRQEFTRSGNPHAPQTQPNGRPEPAANGQRFGFSPGEIAEAASRLAMEKQRNNGIGG